MSMRKDQEIKNGGFGLGELKELQEFHVDGDVHVEEEAVVLSKDEVEKGPVSFDTCSVDGYVASILAMCDDVEDVKGKMEVAINQFITGYPKSDVVITILARYKSIFNRSVVDEKGESDGFVSPTGVKSGSNVSSNDVDMNEEVDGLGTPHIASTFTQLVMKSLDVIEEVMAGAYDTQKLNDIPLFSLGITQDDPCPQNTMTDKISIIEKEAEVEEAAGKGKRKKKISKYGQSPFMN
ncbi:hypothetical protein Hanom_Chr07g00618811 [Helianthus anomalus]